MITNDEVRYLNLMVQASALVERLETESARFEVWRRHAQRQILWAWLVAAMAVTALAVMTAVEALS